MSDVGLKIWTVSGVGKNPFMGISDLCRENQMHHGGGRESRCKQGVITQGLGVVGLANVQRILLVNPSSH